MLTLEELRQNANDDREIIRGWVIASRGFVCELQAELASASLLSSDGKERYVVRVSRADRGCDCVAFARSRKRKFCKHVAAVALTWLSGGDVLKLPSLRHCAPAFCERVEALSIDDVRAVLLFAAGEHKDVYELVMKR